MRLEVSQAADLDIDGVLVFGTELYGEQAADRYVMALLAEFGRIATWPFSSRERHEVRPSVRLRSFRAHNIFYDVHADEVEIVRVLHHSADWVHIL
jgi:toxin ParE1/3/4